MGKKTRTWQSTEYVLGLFGGNIGEARRNYAGFVKKGIDQGKRSDLIGGGLVRSAGGWSALKSFRQAGFMQKADERILGDGEFVSSTLPNAHECLKRKYRIKARDYDLDKVVSRVGELLNLPPKQVITSGKRRHEVMARNIVCYWASKELGISQIGLAQKFGVSQPAISAAIQRGEKLVNEKNFQLE